MEVKNKMILAKGEGFEVSIGEVDKEIFDKESIKYTCEDGTPTTSLISLYQSFRDAQHLIDDEQH